MVRVVEEGVVGEEVRERMPRKRFLKEERGLERRCGEEVLVVVDASRWKERGEGFLDRNRLGMRALLLEGGRGVGSEVVGCSVVLLRERLRMGACVREG